jgi:hypothetical protein
MMRAEIRTARASGRFGMLALMWGVTIRGRLPLRMSGVRKLTGRLTRRARPARITIIY